MPPYAVAADVLAYLGPDHAKQVFGAGQLPAGALNEALDAACVLAKGDMDAVFERSSYLLPLTMPSDTEKLAGLTAKLKWCCSIFAIWYQVGGVVNLPPGFLEAKADAAAWLNALHEGTENLLGIDRIDAEAEKLAAGRVGFASAGQRPAFPARVFRGWGNLFGGGSSGDRHEDRL